VLTTAPHYPDVVPPPDLPPVRSRSTSRWWSLLLVTVILGLVPVLAVTPSARAFVPVVVPVAKAVGATAVSVLGPAAVEWMLGDGTKDEGGDDEDSKNKRGKWGDKLKGLPGLAAGLLGALWGAGEAVELLKGGDGIDMPEDLAEDVADKEDLGFNFVGYGRTWDIRSVEWTQTTNSYGDTNWTVNITEAVCGAGQTSNACPSAPNPLRLASAAEYHCFDPATSGYVVLPTQAVIPGPTSTPCIRNGKILPVHSVVIRQPAQYGQTDGFVEPRRFTNPHFSEDEAPAVGPTITAEVACTDPATGARQTISKTVAGTDVMPLAPCPEGWAPESIGWTGTGTDGAPEYLGGVRPATPEAYPACPPGECVRIVKVDGQPCNALRPECFDWMNTQPPTRVQCEFGPYNMPVAECADLEHIHKSTHGVTWGPNPETGTPQWLPAREDGTIDPTRTGTVYAPEDNPNREYRPPLQGPLIQIGGEPGTDPPGQPDPPPPTVQVPPPVVNPPTNIQDPETTKNCMGGMASWNPVDWVLTPVKCALSWAFVPKQSAVQASVATARANIDNAGLTAWTRVPGDLMGNIPEGGGCMGPALNMPDALGGETYYPLNACDDPMSRYAAMSRALISVVVVVLGGYAGLNGLSVSLTGYRLIERESKGTVTT